jgi:hypothetical protein
VLEQWCVSGVDELLPFLFMDKTIWWCVLGGELLVALVFLAIAFVAYGRRKAELARCHRVEGEVIDVLVNDGCKRPVVRFVAANGRPVTYTSSVGSSNWKINVGDRIALYSDPANPEKPILDVFLAKWGGILMSGIVGGAMLVGVPMLYLTLIHGR